MLSSLVAFALYTVAVIVIGVAATRRPQATVEEIHLGNREHGIWTSALSTSASTESGFVLLSDMANSGMQPVSMPVKILNHLGRDEDSYEKHTKRT